MPQLIDLGRIRFSFLGEYAGGTTYEINDVVRYGANAYVYKYATPAAGNLPTNTTYWSLMTSGIQYEGAWNNATSYQAKDVVSFGPKAYIALSAHSAQNPTQTAYWEVLSDGIRSIGDWSNATAYYYPGDIVTRGGIQYITTSYHVPNNVFSVDLAASKWTVFTSGFRFRGLWQANTVYLKNDLVTDSLNSYVATQDFTSNGVNFATETAGYWTLFTPGTDTLPSQLNNEDNLLVTDGTDPYWSPSINLSGSAQIDGALYLGASAAEISNAVGLSNLIGFGVGNAGGSSEEFTQFTIWNKNTDGLASTDVIAQTHDATDLDGFIDMGITGENFDTETYGITGPNDGYIFMVAPAGTSGDGNLVLATGDTGQANKIIFAAGGLTSGTTQMEITPNENVHVEIDTPSTSPSTGAFTVVGGVGVLGDINAQGNIGVQGNQNIVGNLTIQGSINVAGGQFVTENLSSTDPLLFVGSGNTANVFDLGYMTEAKQSAAAVNYLFDVGVVTASVATLTAASYTVTSKSLTSNVATLGIGVHLFSIGDLITVSGVDAVFNGDYTITDVTATEIRYAKTNANVSSAAASGTAQFRIDTTATSAKGLIVGDFITLTGAGVFNGSRKLSAVTATTVSFASASASYASTTFAPDAIGVRDTRSKYSGLVKDNADGTWYLFSNLGAKPTTTVDFTNAELAFDKLRLGVLDASGSSTFRDDVVVQKRFNVFANAAARDAAIPAPVAGSTAYRTDIKAQEFYTGTKWEVVADVVSPLLTMALL